MMSSLTTAATLSDKGLARAAAGAAGGALTTGGVSWARAGKPRLATVKARMEAALAANFVTLRADRIGIVVPLDASKGRRAVNRASPDAMTF
jgi:hypothetical protein